MPTGHDCGVSGVWSEAQHRCVGKYGEADPINPVNPDWPVCAIGMFNDPVTGDCTWPPCLNPAQHRNEDGICVDNEI